MIDLLAIAAIAGFAGFGWLRGVKGMALRALSLVAGSLAGAFLARPVGGWLASAAGLPLLVAVPLAGVAVAGVATGLLRAASGRVGRERALMLGNAWEPPPWDRWGGTALGALVGAGVVLFAGWVANATGSLHGREAQVRGSLVGRASAQVGEPVIRLVAGEAVGNAVMAATAAWLMSDPVTAKETLGALVRDPRVRELAADEGVRADLLAGKVAALSRAPTLRSLADDPAFVVAARRLRVLPDGPEPTVTPQHLAGALAEKVGPLIRAADALAKDPDVRAALEDPELKAALARGDVAALLAKGGLDKLFQRVSAELERVR